MKAEIKSPIRHMVQGLAHWMAYRNEMSSIQLIEADAVFVACDLMRAHLSNNNYTIEREITKKSFPIIRDGKRIDVGVKRKNDNKYICLIEFKLADATNKGYEGDVEKLSQLKHTNCDGENIDRLVVILYRNPCVFSEPQDFLDNKGNAKRKVIMVDEKFPVKVRHVCTSFVSSTAQRSHKVVCLELV